jgi:transposase
LSRADGNVPHVQSFDAVLPDLNTLDPDTLKALLVEKHTLLLEQHAELISHKNEIDNLKLLIAKLKRMQFGRSSEKLNRQIEQLELRLEDLETNRAAERLSTVPVSAAEVRKPARRPLAAALPREIERLEPQQTACPDCGGSLSALGEDVSEMLEYVPAQYKVIRTVRPKLSCTRCDRILQQPAPHRPIAGSMAGPGLLAHVIVAKYADHLPLYRQSEIYEREGIDIERSTLADWVGGASKTLEPLVARLRQHVLNAPKLHADDTPVPVLAPGNGKTKTGRLWTYVRDDRPSGSTEPPAVWFAYSPSRSSEYPDNHLQRFCGVLQTDAFAGFNRLYERGTIVEAACWAHYPDSAVIQSGCRNTHGRGQATGVSRTDNPDNRQRVSRKASSFGDGRQLLDEFGASPARLQKASRTSRFI